MRPKSLPAAALPAGIAAVTLSGLVPVMVNTTPSTVPEESGTATLVTFHEQRGHVSDKALSKAWADLRGADPFWRD